LRARPPKRIEAEVQAMAGLKEMARTVGKLATGALVSEHLDPRQFPTARSYLKALGPNLKDDIRMNKCCRGRKPRAAKSGGQHQGRPKPGKRGSATARQYLFLAALRLIQDDPVISRWYRAKAKERVIKKEHFVRANG
jgi:Transposase IS116/IS110/IS902 family